jgi:hypothetical protein
MNKIGVISTGMSEANGMEKSVLNSSLDYARSDVKNLLFCCFSLDFLTQICYFER